MDISDIARALGSKGGKARALRLPPAEKQRIAALGGRARALSIHAARRVGENFRYVAALVELRPPPKVRRLQNFTGSLPGIRAPKTPEG